MWRTYPHPDDIIQPGDADEETEYHRVEEKEHEELVVGVADTVVHPDGQRKKGKSCDSPCKQPIW